MTTPVRGSHGYVSMRRLVASRASPRDLACNPGWRPASPPVPSLAHSAGEAGGATAGPLIVPVLTAGTAGDVPYYSIRALWYAHAHPGERW